MGGFVSKVTDAVGLTNYGDQEKAAKRATNAQLSASNDQLAYQKEADALATQRMQPFVDAGLALMPQFQQMMTAQGQQDYLDTNPIFQASVNNTSNQIKGMGAAQGKYGSGGMVNQLFQNYLAQGESMIGNQFNRLLNGVNLGQSAATGQVANSLNSANNITGIYGNQGDIIGSGLMARQNVNNSAVSGGTGLLINGAMLAASGGLSGMFGGAGGIGAAGAGVSGVGTGMSGMSGFSDRRLKTDIKEISRDHLGGVYEFRYRGDNTLYIGRMADELQKTRPDAVKAHESGFLMVTDEFKPRAA